MGLQYQFFVCAASGLFHILFMIRTVLYQKYNYHYFYVYIVLINYINPYLSSQMFEAIIYCSTIITKHQGKKNIKYIIFICYVQFQ